MLNTDGYNEVAKQLLEPFADSDISEREGAAGKTFSYVSPEKYRYRLLQIFTQGYEFGLTDVVEGQGGVRAIAHFKGVVPEENVEYVINGCPVFEPWTFRQEDGTTKVNPDQTYMKLTSAGIKAVSREIGLGLHLYDKAPRSSNGRSSNGSSQSSAPASDGSYSPDSNLGFGKHKEVKWKDVELSYLQWLSKNSDKFGTVADAEIARRAANNVANGQAQAAQAAPPQSGDKYEVPF